MRHISLATMTCRPCTVNIQNGFRRKTHLFYTRLCLENTEKHRRMYARIIQELHEYLLKVFGVQLRRARRHNLDDPSKTVPERTQLLKLYIAGFLCSSCASYSGSQRIKLTKQIYTRHGGQYHEHKDKVY